MQVSTWRWAWSLYVNTTISMSRRRSCWVLGRPASRHRWNVVQAKFAARFICNRMRLMKGCQDTRFVIWTIHPNYCYYCYYCLCYKQILFPPNEPLPVQRLKMPICHLTNGKICTKVEIRDRVDWDPLQLPTTTYNSAVWPDWAIFGTKVAQTFTSLDTFRNVWRKNGLLFST